MASDKHIYLCLAKMSPDGAEQRFIQEAFDTNWVAPLGPNVDAFEKELEDYLGNHRHLAALSSCTAAIHLALLSLKVGQGDEVICQSFSFCASSNPVTYCGAKPIFIDSEKETWNISPELLEEAIQSRIARKSKPKAIIVVDLYGMPAQWEAIEEIAQRYEIPVIEDAANALGSTYQGRPCGTFGDIATLSFNGNKIITTSGGGALVCKDLETKKQAVFLATQARENALHYQHETIGYNYRMSNISAGIGRGQMTVLEDHIQHHKHVHQLYRECLGDLVKDNPGKDFDSNFWLTTVQFNPGTDTVALCQKLNAAGIEARPLWKPMHLQPVYKDAPAFTNGVSETLFKTGLCLPSGPWVTDEDVGFIVETIKKTTF